MPPQSLLKESTGTPRSGRVAGGDLAETESRDALRARIQALETANSSLEHSVNALVHDLRSPLVALLGFSHLLREDYGTVLEETGRHFLDRIEQAGRTMESLLEDLLEFSRIGHSDECRRMVDPRPVLDQLSSELKPRLESAGVELSLPSEPPHVYCDRTRLYQIFSNLLGNALDHMGPCAEPRIFVEVREERGGSHLVVRDLGRGIPPEQHERIFQGFMSLAERSCGGRRSTGIGLAIVRKIAETNGGRAWVDSQSGRGAAFHVTLPAP